MGGTSLAFERRRRSSLFVSRVFVGDAIDIGSGGDPLEPCAAFPNLRSVRQWDTAIGCGDAVFMVDAPTEAYDLVYSSHCLEHLTDPPAALRRWWDLLRVGGHLCVVVPDEVLYERGMWPSPNNSDHKFSFSTMVPLSSPTILTSRRIPTLSGECKGGRIISLTLLDEGFDPKGPRDQTAAGTCECGIELIVRKEARS